MNKRFLVGALAMAGLLMGGQASLQAATRINTSSEAKAALSGRVSRENIAVNAIGGLSFPSSYADSSKWIPKMGHVKRKTNKQRCSHNAKLKRR